MSGDENSAMQATPHERAAVNYGRWRLSHQSQAGAFDRIAHRTLSVRGGE